MEAQVTLQKEKWVPPEKGEKLSRKSKMHRENRKKSTPKPGGETEGGGVRDPGEIRKEKGSKKRNRSMEGR